MSKKNRRDKPKQKTFLNPTAYAFSLRRKTPEMTREEIAATVAHVDDYDPDRSRGVEIHDAYLEGCHNGRELLRAAFAAFSAVVKPRMSERMRRA